MSTNAALRPGSRFLIAALVDAADHPVVGLAFDLEFLEAAVDEQRDALLEGLRIDDQLAVGAFFLLEHRENFLEERDDSWTVRRRRL